MMIVGMMWRDHNALRLLVQILHDPGLLGNELRSRDTQLHQLSECGSKTATAQVVSFWRTRQRVRRDSLPEEHVLALSVLKSILLERLVTDKGIIGADSPRVNYDTSRHWGCYLRKHHECSRLLVLQLLGPTPLLPHPPATTSETWSPLERTNCSYFSSNKSL